MFEREIEIAIWLEWELVQMGFEKVLMVLEMVMIQLWSSTLDHHMKY